jgi:hypothetical protein
MFNGVFDAAQGRGVHHFSGGADHEEIAETLIEYDLGPDRESEQPTMTANGFCPLAAAARASAISSGPAWIK